MSWIPRERFEREYPNILSYLAHIQGKGKFNPKYSQYDLTTPVGRIKAMLDDKDWRERASKDPKLDNLTTAEAHTIEKRLYSDYYRGYGKQFAEFKNRWLDKPVVDYIRVKKDFYRQGIGIALYEEGAKYLATMGLKLYASGNQQPEAKLAWEWLKTHATQHVGIDGKRVFLSFL